MYVRRQRDCGLPRSLIVSVAFFFWIAGICNVPLARASPRTDSGVDLDGKAVDPLSATPGKVVVLIFVRTDCPISNRYAPTIQRLSTEYAGKATFWLVYPDKSESAAAIQRHLREYGYSLSALRDPQHSLVKLGEAQVTPEAAVFDEGGVLVYHGRIDNWYKDFGHPRSGPSTHELDDAIQSALKGKKPDVASASGIGCYISDLE